MRKELILQHLQPSQNSTIKLLGHQGNLDWTFDQNKGLIIQIPENIPGEIAWTFKIEGSEI